MGLHVTTVTVAGFCWPGVVCAYSKMSQIYKVMGGSELPVLVTRLCAYHPSKFLPLHCKAYRLTIWLLTGRDLLSCMTVIQVGTEYHNLSCFPVPLQQYMAFR